MAFDTFMYFTGGSPAIHGESTDSTYSAQKAFELFSFSWGASNPVTIGSASGGIGGGKVSISSFNIMKKTDNASPQLFQACCEGTHYPNATVVMRKAGGKPTVFLQYDFKEVMIESVQWSGSSGGDDTPSESASFAFGHVDIKYIPQKIDGSQGTANPASWDLTKNLNA